jgi:hypothetical protein
MDTPQPDTAIPVLDPSQVASATHAAMDGVQRLATVVAQVQAQLDAVQAAAAEQTSREIDLTARQASITAREMELQQRTSELDARDAEISDRARKLDTHEHGLAERDLALSERERQATERIHAEAERADRAENEARAAAERAAPAERELAEARVRIAALEQALQSATGGASDAARETEQQRLAVEQAESEARAALAQCAHLAKELEGAKSRLAAAEAANHRDAAPREPDAPREGGVPELASLALRRERLKRQRSLLAGKAEQLMQAKVLIEQRSAEAAATAEAKQQEGHQRVSSGDDEGSQRRNEELALRERGLAEQTAAIERERTQVEADRALLQRQRDEIARERSALAAQATGAAAFDADAPPAEPARAPQQMSPVVAAGIASVCVTATLAGVAGTAWWLAGVFDSPIYSAQTRIAMENAGTAREEARASWQAFHTELVRDPRLMEMAAERLKRRGTAELGTPGDLAARLEADLTVESGEPGTISLALKGEGRLATQRTLETFAAALVTASNDGRDRRLDGASTTIVEAASAGDRPVSSERRSLFAMIGGGLGALTVVGMLAGASMFRPAGSRGSAAVKPISKPAATASAKIKNKPAARAASGGGDSWMAPVE